MREKRNSLFFAGVVILFAIFNLFSPLHSFSEKENRYLQGIPELKGADVLSGTFSEDFETFTTDQFIGRDKWISLKTLSDSALLKKDNGRVYFGKEDYLFDAVQQTNQDSLDKNLAGIQTLVERIMERNSPIAFHMLLVPSKEVVLNKLLPRYAPVVDEETVKKKITSSLSDQITILDLLPLFKRSDSYPLYYRTDHHWTTQGAFYAYQYYMESLGEKPLEEEDFQIEKVSDHFYGTLYRKANFYHGSPDEIFRYTAKTSTTFSISINEQAESTSFYDDSFIAKTDQYSYFMGGNHALVEIQTSLQNGKTIVVIKDSFANSFIPFLANHYENLIVIDPRYFGGSIVDCLVDKEIDDILLLYSTSNLMHEKSSVFSK